MSTVFHRANTGEVLFSRLKLQAQILKYVFFWAGVKEPRLWTGFSSWSPDYETDFSSTNPDSEMFFVKEPRCWNRFLVQKRRFRNKFFVMAPSFWTGFSSKIMKKDSLLEDQILKHVFRYGSQMMKKAFSSRNPDSFKNGTNTLFHCNPWSLLVIIIFLLKIKRKLIFSHKTYFIFIPSSKMCH